MDTTPIAGGDASEGSCSASERLSSRCSDTVPRSPVAAETTIAVAQPRQAYVQPQYVQAQPVNAMPGFAVGATAAFGQYFHCQRVLSEKVEQVRAARRTADGMRAELGSLQSTWQVCLILGAFIFVGFLAYFAGMAFRMVAAQDGGAATTVVFIVMFGLLSVMCASFPFGCVLVFRCVRGIVESLGFVIIFAWPILLAVGLTLLIVAVFAGVPYAFYLRSKIKGLKNDVSAWDSCACELEQQLHAMESGAVPIC